MLLIDEVVRGENNYLEDNSALGVLRFPSVVLFLKGWWVNEMVVPVPNCSVFEFCSVDIPEPNGNYFPKPLCVTFASAELNQVGVNLHPFGHLPPTFAGGIY